VDICLCVSALNAYSCNKFVSVFFNPILYHIVMPINPKIQAIMATMLMSLATGESVVLLVISVCLNWQIVELEHIKQLLMTVEQGVHFDLSIK